MESSLCPAYLEGMGSKEWLMLWSLSAPLPETRRDEQSLATRNADSATGQTGAGCPNRTDDLPLTRRVLYQLS